MKKNLLGWFAMATMLVGSGCSSDEVVNDYSPENAIQFGTYVGRGAESRAHAIDLAKLQDANHGFGVFAYYTKQDDWSESSTPNFMNNEKVTWNNSLGWYYEPTKYWPNNVGDKVSFFAYAPYNDSYTSGVTNPSLIYTVSTNVAEQKDLLYADNANTKNLIKNNGTNGISVDNKVTFKFKHALSKIGFKVQAMVDKVNQDATGSADYATDESMGIHGDTTIKIEQVDLIGKFNISGWLNLDGGGWTIGSKGIQTYTLTSSNFNPIADNVTIKEEVLNNAESYFMIIPRSLDALLDDDDITSDNLDQLQIRVVYTVTTEDGKLDGGKSVITNDITSDPFTFTFKKGYAYTFCLHLGMTSVKLGATVDDWEDGGETAVNVPINFN